MVWNSWKGTQDADPSLILYGVLIFSWVEFVWEAYLSVRQRRVYRRHTTPPPELDGIVDAETFEKVCCRIRHWKYWVTPIVERITPISFQC